MSRITKMAMEEGAAVGVTHITDTTGDGIFLTTQELHALARKIGEELAGVCIAQRNPKGDLLVSRDAMTDICANAIRAKIEEMCK